ncbi:MAG: glycosyl transferase family 2 [Paenibacillaceae bacterium]|nr:glycosyl transferase family 2 [Paenibacillaceae bacterium]
MHVLIPAYEPDKRLLDLIRQLKASGVSNILVVDDGSGEDYGPLFHAAESEGCTVLTHPVNRGKGRALKTGFRHLLETTRMDMVVCADSDGQHLPQDILKVAQAVRETPGRIVLGSRQFTGKVPLRSSFGNTATRRIYSLLSGIPLQDTQTGLRGYSRDMLEWLCQVPGERFEYEMNLLLQASKAGYSFYELSIETIYIDHNSSSHFRPLADSLKIYWPIAKFGSVSLISALLDILLVLLIQYGTGNLLIAVWGARLCSSVFNYTMNKTFVFNSGKPTPSKRSMPRYFALAIVILILNYGLMFVLFGQMGTPLLAAKLLTEAMLFAFSYWCQQRFVYA